MNEELQQAVVDKEQEVGNELDAFLAALLITAGTLISSKAGVSEIQKTIEIDKNNFINKVNTILDGLVSIAAIPLKKARTIDKNVKISSEVASKIDSFITTIKIEYKALIDSKTAEIVSTLSTQIATGAKKSDIINSVKKTLESSGLGNNNIRGLKTIITTKAFELESLVNKELSILIGVSSWKYEGPSDSKNRAWCASHVGNTLTKKEFEDWRNKSWDGKRDGDPFVVRGGWNCRHHFTPIKK